MKVIIQDLKTRRYLAQNGEWVADRDDARDFRTLLNAYHFARNHTNRAFHVLLYCPDDQFCTSIISGFGTTAAKFAPPSAQAAKNPAGTVLKTAHRPNRRKHFVADADVSRFHLN